jgi:Carboxypeptidase regulatory-like domain
MKHNRNVYQFDSMFTTRPAASVEASKTQFTSVSKLSLNTTTQKISARLHILSAFLLCLLFIAVVSAHAQSTFGSVRGIVQDNTGAGIAGSQVVLHSTDENTEHTASADGSGSFIFENVKAGKYSLHAHHDGFADIEMSGISVDARQDLRLTVSLTIATQATTVEVTSGGDQINTENATLGDSKDNVQMTQLPLNNRATTTSPLGALGLSPNVQTDSSGNIALGGASSSSW